jgi:predicted enzyme related to lactoylglutathione lyase
MKNALNWFEIPALNFERAKAFYEAILDSTFETMSMESMGMTMAFFPSDWENGVGGGVCTGPGCEPSDKGTIVYLNAGEDLSDALGRVEAAGGKVILPKTSLGDNGFMAMFIDTEGNRVGFHSNK